MLGCAIKVNTGTYPILMRMPAWRQVPQHDVSDGVQSGGQPEQDPASARVHRAVPAARGRAQPHQHPHRPGCRRSLHPGPVARCGPRCLGDSAGREGPGRRKGLCGCPGPSARGVCASSPVSARAPGAHGSAPCVQARWVGQQGGVHLEHAP